MSPFKTLSEKFNAWLRFRSAVRELSNLSDRELDDIGIARHAIAVVVEDAFAHA